MKRLLFCIILLNLLYAQDTVRVFIYQNDIKFRQIEIGLIKDVFMLYNNTHSKKLIPKFIPISFRNMLAEITEANRTDLMMGINSVTIREERKALMDFSVPYFPTSEVIFSANQHSLNWKLPGKRIGYVESTLFESLLDKFSSYGIIKIPFKNASDKITALQNGTIDFAAGDVLEAWTFKGVRQIDRFDANKIAYYGIIFPKNWIYKTDFNKVMRYYVVSRTYNNAIRLLLDENAMVYFKSVMKDLGKQ